MGHQLRPAAPVVPEPGLKGGLHGDADVRLTDDARRAEVKGRRRLPWTNAEDVPGGAVEAHLPEVHRQVRIVAVKEQAYPVSGVRCRLPHDVGCREADVRILPRQQFDDVESHVALKPAAMQHTEVLRVVEPAEQVAERAGGEGNQHITVLQGQGFVQQRRGFVTAPDLNAEADEVLFGRGDPAGPFMIGRSGGSRNGWAPLPDVAGAGSMVLTSGAVKSR
ncbi:hypothetical protein SAMN05216522_10973 [Rosenbergiella nectarea]|uniref:Uncharacterized protein n=1 Tax=Rosenbergiella nectarea TaxID=988801 RepID=A0A1H9KCZ6_9GAMM|nr:hypothetical protein SAMN05216522_10973 [Rosenbergiella nectarea]